MNANARRWFLNILAVIALGGVLMVPASGQLSQARGENEDVSDQPMSPLAVSGVAASPVPIPIPKPEPVPSPTPAFPLTSQTLPARARIKSTVPAPTLPPPTTAAIPVPAPTRSAEPPPVPPAPVITPVSPMPPPARSPPTSEEPIEAEANWVLGVAIVAAAVITGSVVYLVRKATRGGK
ncbi:MAG: hypothetical protein HY670_01045 [Chloroflexi bacterium]|nr:hypothetical protein [Chloroflexota bacterium]